jgi:hypothetical protein
LTGNIHKNDFEYFSKGSGSIDELGNYWYGNYSLIRNVASNITVTTRSKFAKDVIFRGHLLFNNSIMNFIGGDDTNLQLDTSTPPEFGSCSIAKTGPGKLILINPFRVLGMAFGGGVIQSYATKPLIFLSGSTTFGANDLSHVTGPVHKIGNDAFTVPIGSGTKLTPVSITAPLNITDEFSAEYITASPTSSGYNTISKAGSLTNVYDSGFWDVQRVAGNSNVSVSLGYNVPAGYITNQSKLRVAHWNGSIWEDLGNGGTRDRSQ